MASTGRDGGPLVDSYSAAEASLLALNQYRGKDGGRAPHKPLLVLLALHQMVETGSSRLAWSEAGDALAGLIAEFGPPSRTGRLQSAAYPFTHLRTDNFWQLSESVPMDNVGPLRDGDVSGRFSDDIEAALRSNANRIPMLARQIVEAQFPTTIADDVLSAVGFDPESLRGPAEVTAVVGGGSRRSTAWRADILTAWDAACAFCGFDGSLAGAPVGIEAAHVRWFNFDGPDEPDNGLALCSLHHKLFDRGVLGLTTKVEIVVSDQFRASGAGRGVYELHGRPLSPRPGTVLPAERHIDWHAREVFRGRALIA